MIRLLILSCGTNACSHISKILKTKFKDDFYIIGCDINKPWLIPFPQYLDEFIQCPLSSEPSYYQFILGVCQTKKIDFLLPSFDSDQFLFACDNDDLSKINVKSFGISKRLAFYRNKEIAANYLNSIGIPIPRSYKIEEVVDDRMYFIKPNNGVASIGARLSVGGDIKSNPEISSYIIQEVCSEPEYTLECFNYLGKVYSACRERIASKSGVCTKTRVFENADLQKYAEMLVANADLPYIFNMQFMKNTACEYVCTDLNLRAAGGMSLSYAAGWDEVSALAGIMLGKSKEEIVSHINIGIGEKYVVRHYEETVTKSIKRRIAFDLDGTLLDSRKRHEIVMDDVLKKHSFKFDACGLVSFKADGYNNIDWLLSKGVSEDVAKDINAEWISLIEKDEILKTDVLYPKVIDVLKTLCKENDLFLVTARKNKDNAYEQVNQLGVEQFFSGVFVVDSCRETPMLKAKVLTKCRADCFIGDTESDYEAAKIAGCGFKAVSYGFRSEVYLRKNNIDFVNDIFSALDE